MSHWFDRLAAWSAEDREESEKRLMTRRQAVGAAAMGAGAVGLLGSPLLSKALAESPCECADKATRKYDDETGKLLDKYVYTPSNLLTPLSAGIFIVAWAGLLAGTVAGQRFGCGTFADDCGAPTGKKPPPKAQPCTQRGGARRRDDQCGGNDITAPPGGSGCGEGTSDCNDGSGLCCFGDDLCCGCNCCIAVVGCTCCG